MTPHAHAVPTVRDAATPLEQARAMTRVAVRERAPLVVVIAILMVAMGALTGALWPSLQDAFEDLPATLSDGLGKILAGADLTTPVGWMNTEMVSLVLPGGLIAVAVLSAAQGIAGEEQAKTLGVLLSAPVSRTSFLLAKSAAMVISVLLAALGAAAGIVVGSSIGDLGIEAAGVLGACAHGVLLGVFFGAVTVLASALTGDARLSSSVATGLAVLAFALNAFLPLSDGLTPYARLSPWYYFAVSDPLATGADGTHLAVLGGAALILTVLAVFVYRRRDLRG